jgi:hypothetical protein
MRIYNKKAFLNYMYVFTNRSQLLTTFDTPMNLQNPSKDIFNVTD